MPRPEQPDIFFPSVQPASDNTSDADAGEFVGPAEVYARSSSSATVRIFGLLVVYLFLTMHIGVRACNVILRIAKLVLSELGQLPRETDRSVVMFPITLQTSMKRLGLEDTFSVYPLCPTCLRLYPFPSRPDGEPECEFCNEPLYVQHARSISDYIPMLSRAKKKDSERSSEPRLAIPIATLSSQLAELLAHDGVEEAMETWKLQDRSNDVLNDVMDGAVWKELKGADGNPFFDVAQSKELRLGFTMSLDWCAPVFPSLSDSVFSPLPLGFNLEIPRMRLRILLVFYQSLAPTFLQLFGATSCLL